jgi:hypothetical protein
MTLYVIAFICSLSQDPSCDPAWKSDPLMEWAP